MSEIYNDKYYGECIGRIEDGEVYNDKYYGECVGRIEGDEIYNHKYYGECVGRIEGNEVYNHKYYGECVGRIEGSSVREGTAALLLLLIPHAAAAGSGSLESDEQESDSSDDHDRPDESRGAAGSSYSDAYSHSTSGGSGGYVPSSSSSAESGRLGLVGTIILLVIGLAIWSDSNRPAAPAAIEPNSVKIVGDGSPGAIISEIGSLLGKESPHQIIDHGACPYEGCRYGERWMAQDDVDAYSAPPEKVGVASTSLQRKMVIRKGTWVTTVTGVVIATQHEGRVDLVNLHTTYGNGVKNGPPLSSGQVVAIYILSWRRVLHELD